MRIYAAILLLLLAILPVRSATKRALLIGISEYPENESVLDAGWPSIHGANDVHILEQHRCPNSIASFYLDIVALFGIAAY